MSIYCPLLDNEAKIANDRNAYKRLTGIILDILNDIPSGKETLRTQLSHWKLIYKNRPAMMDELNKAFHCSESSTSLVTRIKNPNYETKDSLI